MRSDGVLDLVMSSVEAGGPETAVTAGVTYVVVSVDWTATADGPTVLAVVSVVACSDVFAVGCSAPVYWLVEVGYVCRSDVSGVELSSDSGTCSGEGIGVSSVALSSWLVVVATCETVIPELVGALECVLLRLGVNRGGL